jgi:hypothetical protein
MKNNKTVDTEVLKTLVLQYEDVAPVRIEVKVIK